jgi:hypothetical protein
MISTAASAMPHVSAAGYVPHALHGPTAVWTEKNCYVDLWIEMLHALGIDPRPLLGFTIAVDFEGDQWTFFKPPHADLDELYGIDVQELNIWRPLRDHLVEHVTAGRVILAEVDACWLPDTAATSYRREHDKTTIAVAAIDAGARELLYFHNAGCYELSGDDFDGVLQTSPEAGTLPYYAEFVRFDRLLRRPVGDLTTLALERLGRHLKRAPPDNPVTRFSARLHEESGRGLRGLTGPATYHRWAFATTRQMGAACELAAAHLCWLERHGAGDYTDSALHFERLASLAKALIFKGARAATTGRPVHDGTILEDMATEWSKAMDGLRGTLGTT